MAVNPLSAVTSNSVAKQFLIWGVLQQLAGALLQPIVQEIMTNTWAALPSNRVSPQEAADLVLKGWWDMPRATDEAKAAGFTADRFQAMVDSAGEPIGLQDLLLAYRRGFLEWDLGKGGPPSVLEGIRQSRVRDEWADTINKLRLQPIPVAEAVAATVRHQITPELGAQIAYYNGISGADFTTLVNTYGSPPGIAQVQQLVRRGLVAQQGTGAGVLSLQQAVAESDYKDKWYPALVDLLVYHPPPRTITALERAGAISKATALTLYHQAGLSAEMAAAYSENASSVKLTKTKQLAETTVLSLYHSKVLTHTEAGVLLGDLGYDAQEITWILSWEDMRRELAAVEKAVTRIANLYTARKIGHATASADLDTLGLPAGQRDELLRTWTLERAATVKVLTAAEIADALFHKIIDQGTAQGAMESLGYDAFDAWVMLSNRMHAKLPGEPPPAGPVTGALP
jgi:hypothetical protein